jgi:hypothetical protein
LGFLSLIIPSAIGRIMKRQNLFKTYAIAEAVSEFMELRVVSLISGKSYSTEPSRVQRLLFEKCDIPIPPA